MTSKVMRIAAVQFYREKNVDNNWERAINYIKKAAADNVDLIIFPEYFLSAPTDISDGLLERFCVLAQEHGMDIVTGTYGIKDTADGKYYNCSSYVDKSGKVLVTYRKNHLWHPERKHFTPGSGFVTVTNRFGIKVGICICWDIIFNDCFTEMSLNQGAELIVAPAFWSLEDAGTVGLAYDCNSERKLIDATCTARAFENEIAMVFVNGAASPRSYDPADPVDEKAPSGDSLTLAGHTQIAVPFKGAISRCNHYFEEMLVQDVDVGQLTHDAEIAYKVREDWAIKNGTKL